jgi:hypothetical protein
VSVDPHPRPGVFCIVLGTWFLALSAGTLATTWSPGPGWLLFAFANGLVAVALFLRGCSQLRQAKAARPDLSWWQFLHVNPVALAIGLAVLLVLLPIIAAMSPEQHNNLLYSLLEFANLIRMAKGEL